MPPPLWTRDKVAAHILAGECLVIYDDQLLRIPKIWLEKHPGGSLAILHFVGRDATDEIEAYHADDSRKLMQKYVVGTVERDAHGVWQPLLPPIMSGWVRNKERTEWVHQADAVRSTQNTALSPSSQILLVQRDSLLVDSAAAPTLETLQPAPTDLSPQLQRQHSIAYKALHDRITRAGLYETPFWTGYGPEVMRYCLLAAISVFAYRHNWLTTSAVFLGLMWQQLTFTVHDLGHLSVTKSWVWDRIISILIADFIGGLSIGWWVENHNVHHLVPNHPSHDPDIEHLPFFAISPVFFSSLFSSYYRRTMAFDRFSKAIISVQHRLFYIVMALARFNLYANSYVHLVRKPFEPPRAYGGRWAWVLEVTGVAFFWTWFGAVLHGCGSWQKALAYLLVSHVAACPVHIQIVLSHFSMSTADLGPTESFADRQLRTTTDVECDSWYAFIHGGLNLQVTHHLFPRLPRHNLRKASLLVKEFAAEQGLTYAEFGFVAGNGEVIGTLQGVAEQVKFIGHVASVEAREAVERKLGIFEAEVEEKSKMG